MKTREEIANFVGYGKILCAICGRPTVEHEGLGACSIAPAEIQVDEKESRRLVHQPAAHCECCRSPIANDDVESMVCALCLSSITMPLRSDRPFCRLHKRHIQPERLRA